MDFTHIDKAALAGKTPIGESEQFALYAVGEGTYLLVQRHEGTDWTALRVSGDGVFRIAALLTEATRHLYRDVAAQLSPNYQRTEAPR
jgi:hypothetical protein